MFIALLTDFGTRDYFVGAMKGVILSINKDAKIIDITHEIEPQNIVAAGFTLEACRRNFPPQTIFVAVVDPGVGSARRAILVAEKEYFFIAPDNGLLSFVFSQTDDFRVYEISDPQYFNHPVSATFHGRDIFAPAAAHLSKGVRPEKFGPEIADFVFFPKPKPRRTGPDRLEAEIIYCDRFGNLITNLTPADLPRSFSLSVNGRRVDRLQRFFAEAEKDRIFMIFGSAGFLEIAAFQNSAEKLLGARTGDKIEVLFTD